MYVRLQGTMTFFYPATDRNGTRSLHFSLGSKSITSAVQNFNLWKNFKCCIRGGYNRLYEYQTAYFSENKRISPPRPYDLGLISNWGHECNIQSHTALRPSYVDHLLPNIPHLLFIMKFFKVNQFSSLIINHKFISNF